ncbi:hypothetical protein [Methanobrevibacter sp. DSM 116169]
MDSAELLLNYKKKPISTILEDETPQDRGRRKSKESMNKFLKKILKS